MPEVKTLSQINVLVAEHVMGWPHIDENEPYRYHNDKGGVIVNGVAQRFRRLGNEWVGIPDEWYPATQIEDAWNVVEKFAGAKIEHEYLKTFRCEFDCGGASVHAVSTSATLAICLAALKSIGIDVNVKEEG